MAGFKSLFRRKSRGKSISGERPDLSDAPPSPARPQQVDSSARNTASSQYQSVNNSTARSSTPNPRAPSRASMPQDPSALVDQRSAPYDAMPSGRAPEKGNYSLPGNSGAAIPKDVAQSQTRSRAGSAANSMPRASGAQTPTRRSMPPGIATTTDQSSGQRSQSRASAYTDTSRYNEETPDQRYQEDIPPVPKPYEGNLDANNGQSIRVVSQQPAAPSGYGNASNASNGTRDPSHRREISTASVGSTPRTPIADEFSTQAWYKQRGSPPIPEFSQAYPRKVNTRESNGQAIAGSPLDNRSNAADVTPSRISGQYQAPSRSQYQASDVMDRSAAMGRALGTSGTSRTQMNNSEEQNGNSVGSAYGDSSSKIRRVSVPTRGLDKPLPVPNETAQLTASDNNRAAPQQKLPIREIQQSEQATNIVTTSQTANRSSGVPQSPVTPRQQNAVPVGSMDSPPSPVRSGKYTRTPMQTSNTADIRSGPQQLYQRPYIVADGANPPTLAGVVDLQNTVDTSTHVRYADAVIHDTVIPSVHHIREERITREIHNYHVHHRILPIIDVQVLPTKHIVRSSNAADGEYIEIPEELIPGREHRHWVIAETVSKIAGTRAPATQEQRQFTARTFGATEGDYKEYINEQGVPTTETWWIHPPTLAVGAYMAGETLPLYFDE